MLGPVSYGKVVSSGDNKHDGPSPNGLDKHRGLMIQDMKSESI